VPDRPTETLSVQLPSGLRWRCGAARPQQGSGRRLGRSRGGGVAVRAESPEQRRPWDLPRAFRTAAFFDALPNPLSFLFRRGSASGGSNVIAPGDVLWNQENPRRLDWGSLDDVVMGGASRSSFDGATWKGTIVTAGGGFAGVRTRSLEPALDVSSCRGLRIRVSGGDGQRFKLIIRDSYDWNGVAWSHSFDTGTLLPGAPVEISVPFEDFVPTLFARKVTDGRPFNRAQLTALQFALSKFEYDGGLNPKFKAGDFSLTLELIAAF